MFKRLMLLAVVLTTSSVSFAGSYSTDYYYGNAVYEVTVTNITKGQTLTPILAATHHSYIKLFELGEPAISELAEIAESGNIAPLNTLLSASSYVKQTTSTEGLLFPGNSVTFEIKGNYRTKLSMVAMLVPTNDTFFALNSVSLPSWGSRTMLAKAYDAGSEMNDELCANVPGPTCGGTGLSPEDEGEGYIYISPGISGEADLKSSDHDWRGAVAKVSVRRIQ